MLIAEQIERAAAATSDPDKSESSTPAPEGLKRSEGAEKVVLSLSAKLPISETQSSSEVRSAIGSLKMNPLKAPSTNRLKRANVFKSSTPTSAVGSSGLANDKERSGL
jgi:DNA/RNA-binding protein KIN17